MAGTQVTAYANELRDELALLGGVAPLQLQELVDAATALKDALDAPAGTLSTTAWNDARQRWENALGAVSGHLADVLLGVLADVPGLTALIADVTKLAREGVHGELDVGPVHLSVSSATLVVQPSTLAGGVIADPVTVGPFKVGAIAASLVSPFGGGKGMPGGGSIVRIPHAVGADSFGGTLELPLGPAQVSAAATLAMIGGQPSFLAILGIEFLPPIQLSFGFSLDRVGGIVGVNRRVDTDALRAAVRTGTAGDILFAARPPADPLALVGAADRLFPARAGTHLVGPSLRISWLSFGTAGSLLSLDLGVVVEIPSGRVAILGVAKASIPSVPFVLNLRLDLLGLIDPVEELVSMDASLVDSHVLGIFEVYGDAAMRFSWGASSYMLVSVGGFYPGFNPEPARVPAMRRVGLAIDNPISIITIRAEGYFAVTSNSIQFGGRLDVGIDIVIQAHGFVQVDAIVQFRPFHFEARISAGFDVSVEGFSFASVTLRGSISGPGPIVIQGSLSIDVFLFSISWDQTFTLGSGPSDALPAPPNLLQVIVDEFSKEENVHAASIGDPDVVLAPRPGDAALAAVPPTGTLRVDQRRAPLGLLIERVDGRPLDGPHGVSITTTGDDVTGEFSPGSYVNLTHGEALNRPPYDVLPAGQVLSLADPPLSDFPKADENRQMRQIVIKTGQQHAAVDAAFSGIAHIAALTDAARRPPALSDASKLVTANPETWTVASAPNAATFSSATAAHQFARYKGTVALASADADAPVSLAGIV